MGRITGERGFLVIAQQSGNTDYIRMAYALALSLKASQKEAGGMAIAVEAGTKVPEQYRHAFEHIVEIPWSDDATESKWKIENKWKVYYMTPYERTIFLDTDMLVTTDISEWWDILDERDLWMATQPVNFRGQTISRFHFRQAFIENKLPMIYTAFTYFRQSERATEFFNNLRIIFQNWSNIHKYYKLRQTSDALLEAMEVHRYPGRWEWEHFLKNFPDYMSGDLAYALCVRMMDAQDEFAPEGSFPTFAHMKMGDQGIDGYHGIDWTEHLNYTLTDDLTLTVGGYVQRYPFHYVEKDWISNDIVRKLERAANG